MSSKECDDAIAVIQNEAENINPAAPHPGYDWGTAAEDINTRANGLSASLAQVVMAAKSNPKNLPAAAKATQVCQREEKEETKEKRRGGGEGKDKREETERERVDRE
jgi:hypothetical protein